MRLWRISEWQSLDGGGGLVEGGRWHHAKNPIVYTANSSALAILEVLVRQPRTRLPPPFQLLEIEADDSLEVADWPTDQDIRDKELTASWGTAFLRSMAAPLARVPSVIAPEGWNYLLNPLHPDAAQVRVVRAGRWPWDARLFGREQAR